MNGAIEAAGDMATASGWARAVEPVAGEAMDHAGPAACLNCGTALAGRYCHGCGQSRHVHRTLMSIVHDLLHGVFHFEGKIWRTVPMLVLHPGQLTRRYIDGERARFVSPLALFLFTVFLMFATYSALGQGDFAGGVIDGWNAVDTQATTVRKQAAVALAGAETDRARLIAAHQPTMQADARITRARADVKRLDALAARGLRDGKRRTGRVYSSFGWLNDGLKRAGENPGLTLYKVQSAAYKFSWALIFLSTPLVALVFLWKRRFGLYDHATFVTYSISFMSLLAIALELMLAVSAPEWLFVTLLLLVPPAHLFVQLRGAYALSVLSALWRTVFLLGVAWLVLALFVFGVIALEVAH